MKKAVGLLVGLLVCWLVFWTGRLARAEEVDILIRGGTIVTVNETFSICTGSIAIKEDKIVAIGSLDKSWRAKKTIDATGKIVMPGIVNAHTHAAMVYFRGLKDDLPLKTWWNDYMFPAEKEFVNPEFVYNAMQLACAEMIRCGTTTFSDMYFFEEGIAQIVKYTGMRAVLCEALMDLPTPNKKTPEEGLKFTEEFIKKWKDDPLIKPAVGLHAPYTCSPALIRKAAKLSKSYEVPLVIHIAETKDEINEIRIKYNMTPVEYLNDIIYLSSRIVAVDCVHLNTGDIEMLKKDDVKIVHNVESNLKLASGIPQMKAILDAGLTVGLGTDGAASNNNLDMFESMNFCAKLYKGLYEDPTIMDAKTVLKMATINGARVLGLEDKIGSIEIGKRADIIILDFNKPRLTPLYDICSHLVYAANGEDVETVIVNGRILMENKKLLTIDEQEVLRKAKEYGNKIKKWMLER